MPRAMKGAGKAEEVKPAEVSQEAKPENPPVDVPEGSIRVLGFASNGKPVQEQAAPRPVPVSEMVPVTLKPSGEAGSFFPGFQRNPMYPDPALVQPKAPETASPWDPRSGVRILGASPSLAAHKTQVVF